MSYILQNARGNIFEEVNFMKRFLLFTGTAVLLLFLAACSGGSESNEGAAPRNDVTEPVLVEESAPAEAESDTELEVEEVEEAPEMEAEPETAVDVEESEAAPVEVKEEAAGKPQLIEFYADWWPTCRRMEPIVHGLEDEYSASIEFVYVDIDDPESADAKAQYGFRVQPHFVLVDGNGEVINQWFGYNESVVFEEAFADILSN